MTDAWTNVKIDVWPYDISSVVYILQLLSTERLLHSQERTVYRVYVDSTAMRNEESHLLNISWACCVSYSTHSAPTHAHRHYRSVRIERCEPTKGRRCIEHSSMTLHSIDSDDTPHNWYSRIVWRASESSSPSSSCIEWNEYQRGKINKSSAHAIFHKSFSCESFASVCVRVWVCSFGYFVLVMDECIGIPQWYDGFIVLALKWTWFRVPCAFSIEFINLLIVITPKSTAGYEWKSGSRTIVVIASGHSMTRRLDDSPTWPVK